MLLDSRSTAHPPVSAAGPSVLHRIVAAVAGECGLTPGALIAPTRGPAPIAAARQRAMYLCHVAAGRSLTEVGRFFGRDRTTVAHACHLVEDLRDDAAYDERLEALEHCAESSWVRGASR